MGNDPELALRMMHCGYGVAEGGADWPTAIEEVDLLVSIEAAAQVQSQILVYEAWVGSGLEHGTLLGLSFGAGIVGGAAGGAADGAVLAGQFGLGQHWRGA
jgi:hypothetical protein